MKKITSLTLLLFALACTISSSVANEIKDRSVIVAKTEEIIKQFERLGWFSGSVLLAQNGRVFYTYDYGLQNLESKLNNTSNTRYNLGSIMKTFTGVLVLQQIQAAKLNLSDTIGHFDLGFSNPEVGKITVEQLLYHRSGLPDVFTAEYRENQLAFDTVQKKLNLMLDTSLLFEPGSDRKYSNYGYIVLGAILEKITGKPFEQLLNDNIFVPAKLENTSFKVIPNHKWQSTRYTYLYDNTLKEVGVTEHPGPDGGIESSVYDLHKFFSTLFYDNVLLKRKDAQTKRYFKMDKGKWVSYGGGVGVSAATEINFHNGYEVIVLTNTDNLIAEFISQRIMAVIETGQYSDVKARDVNFIYQYYQDKKTYSGLKQDYANAGYNAFIGRTLNTLGMQLVQSKSWREAFDTFYYLKELFPTAPEVYDSLAYAHYQKGELLKAKQTFKLATDINSKFNSAYKSNNYQN